MKIHALLYILTALPPGRYANFVRPFFTALASFPFLWVILRRRNLMRLYSDEL
jgi:hypothetical protein